MEKDINIPKGTEITAYIAGNIPLEKSKFEVYAMTALVRIPMMSVHKPFDTDAFSFEEHL